MVPGPDREEVYSTPAAAGPLQMVPGPDGEQVYSAPAAAGLLQMVPGPDGEQVYSAPAAAGPLQMVQGPNGEQVYSTPAAYILVTWGEDSFAAAGCIAESSLAARGGPPVRLQLLVLPRSSTHSCDRFFHSIFKHF